MPVHNVMFDTDATDGEKLDPAVRAEIDILAPSTLSDGDVKTNMLDDEAVTAEKIAEGAVGTDQIADAGVESGNMAAASVGTSALVDHAVTLLKLGTGAVGAVNSAGIAIASTDCVLTAAQYAGITPNASTTYYVVG